MSFFEGGHISYKTMKICILVNPQTEYDFIISSLTNPSTLACQDTVLGKIYSKEVIVAKTNETTDIAKLLGQVVNENGINFVISLGMGESLSPYLRPSDFIVSSDGNKGFDSKFMDIVLSEELNDEDNNVRVLAGKVLDDSSNNHHNVSCFDAGISSLQNICLENSLPLVVIRRIVLPQTHDENEREYVQNFLWILKRTLEKM